MHLDNHHLHIELKFLSNNYLLNLILYFYIQNIMVFHFYQFLFLYSFHHHLKYLPFLKFYK
nr:MAG TPA: hypothetical protein [Caudoviricetes sp.]